MFVPQAVFFVIRINFRNSSNIHTPKTLDSSFQEITRRILYTKYIKDNVTSNQDRRIWVTCLTTMVWQHQNFQLTLIRNLVNCAGPFGISKLFCQCFVNYYDARPYDPPCQQVTSELFSVFLCFPNYYDLMTAYSTMSISM
jgi:hypothetical protein